jgi:hypothetical protein
MWSSYNGTQYQTDMQTAKRLGFNSLRVFLAARPGVFDFPTPTVAELRNLRDLYGRSKTVGIPLHLTLFDWWWTSIYGRNPYGHIARSQAWAKAIIGALPDLANVSCIEIKNEIKFASTATYSGGFDSGWPSGVTQYTQVGHVAQVWAQQIIAYIRSLADIPVTASCTDGPSTNLTAGVNFLKGTPSQPDWWEWHCYSGTNYGLIYSQVQAAISAVGNKRDLYIAETGCTSVPRGPSEPLRAGVLQGQQREADYIQAVRWSCAQLGLPEPGVWTLFDLNPSSQFPTGDTYGLYDVNRNIKLAGQMYLSYPLGSAVPRVPLNGTMQGGNQPDALGNALPPRWYLYKAQQAQQLITSGIDTTSAYQGNPSILLTGSNGTISTENPPALQADPVTAPVPQAGQTYTFSAHLMASGSYGQPALEVSWYGANGAYISSTNGAQLTLTSSFAQYSLQSTAPTGALYAKLLVKVKDNAGSIWVANATWA